ncbi:MAG TPA: polysaccharide biosynthesis/export family protein [Verrucomicrobiae bacterium]|nr:polysaccharide biosynthesis/export family protein [Verrucomicrobiae bacterium]
MKSFIPLPEKSFLKTCLLLPMLALILTLAGCATQDYSEMMAVPTGDTELGGARLQVGDTIDIGFDGLPNNPTAQHKTINEDGTITLADIGSIKVSGKTTGEVESAIHDLYVPAIYNHLTVTVKAGDRVYYVRGEVKNPGRQIYVGQITVTKAITSAGDFGDFANRKNVLLIRSNGKRFILNCNKILDGKAPDPGVYPGDQIEVRRNIF